MIKKEVVHRIHEENEIKDEEDDKLYIEMLELLDDEEKRKNIISSLNVHLDNYTPSKEIKIRFDDKQYLQLYHLLTRAHGKLARKVKFEFHDCFHCKHFKKTLKEYNNTIIQSCTLFPKSIVNDLTEKKIKCKFNEK